MPSIGRWHGGRAARIHADAVKRVLGLLEPRTPGPPRPRLMIPFVRSSSRRSNATRGCARTRLHTCCLTVDSRAARVLCARSWLRCARAQRASVSARRAAHREQAQSTGRTSARSTSLVAAENCGSSSCSVLVARTVGEFVFDLTVFSLLRSLRGRHTISVARVGSGSSTIPKSSSSPRR